MLDWTTVLAALIGALLGGGGVAGIIKARAGAESTVSKAWAQYSKKLEEEIATLRLEIKQIPALRAEIATLSAEVGSLRTEKISMQAQLDVLLAWNEDMKAWSRMLSSQVIELGGTPKPFKRRRKTEDEEKS